MEPVETSCCASAKARVYAFLSVGSYRNIEMPDLATSSSSSTEFLAFVNNSIVETRDFCSFVDHEGFANAMAKYLCIRFWPSLYRSQSRLFAMVRKNLRKHGMSVASDVPT
jgi:hypothetical protein